MSPARRRDAVKTAQETLRVSQRLACRAICQPRSTQRYAASGVTGGEKELVAKIFALAAEHPRYGYRRIGRLLEQDGRHVNHKRLYRLWRREGLHVPAKPRRRRKRNADSGAGKIEPIETGQVVWAWDVISDQTTAGHKLSWLSILNEATRECLALDVHRGISASVALSVLQQTAHHYGAPQCLRSDNSRHLTARKIRQWLSVMSIELAVGQPGSPWENARVEAFHRRMRDEFLNVDSFGSLEEARLLTARWQYHYNHRRAHSALDYLTPSEFARRLREGKSAPETDK